MSFLKNHRRPLSNAVPSPSFFFRGPRGDVRSQSFLIRWHGGKDREVCAEPARCTTGGREREKCFDWALGDPSRKTKRCSKLPFDAVWEGRKLIIEIDEEQHTQSTPFFDNTHKLTVSGVHRGKQRMIYDARKRTAAKQAGYRLVAIAWPRNKKQRVTEDKAALLQLLRDEGILPPPTGTEPPQKAKAPSQT